jgi:hypothetical protein
MADLTAWEEVLGAAIKLTNGDTSREFSEWELTVEAWKMNPARWGLRGFEHEHPDHKRVMMEVMGSDSLVKEGFFEKTRTNHYRVTAAGVAKGLAIVAPKDTRQRAPYLYDDIKGFVFHRVFDAYLQDPNEPRTWLGVAAFLNLKSHDPKLLESQLKRIRGGIDEARKFMSATGRAALRRGDADRTISRERLDKLEQFLQVLEERFRAQFEAIRAKAH